MVEIKQKMRKPEGMIDTGPRVLLNKYFVGSINVV